MRKSSIIMLEVAILLVAGALIFYFTPPNSLSLCSERTVMEKTSPDGRYAAVLMRLNCVPATLSHAHINLRLASSPPFPKYSLGAIHDGEIFGTSKNSGERFCWSSPQRLEIDYLAGDNNPTGRWMDVTTGGDYSLCRLSR